MRDTHIHSIATRWSLRCCATTSTPPRGMASPPMPESIPMICTQPDWMVWIYTVASLSQMSATIAIVVALVVFHRHVNRRLGIG